MLDKEFQYFLDHQDELVKKYNGKFIVIKGQKVVGNHDTFIDAYYKTQEQHELGTFLIQECLPGSECYTVVLQAKFKEIAMGKPTDGKLTVSILQKR